MKSIVVVLMGVAGSGKTTIGQLLSNRSGWRFLEGDDFHSEQNREKMRTGVPLSEQDRLPWLHELSRQIISALERGENLIVSCSALKQRYREILRQRRREVVFIHLRGSKETISSRMELRNHPFMNVTLLASQFATLEEPHDALGVDINRSPDSIVSQIETYMETLIREG